MRGFIIDDLGQGTVRQGAIDSPNDQLISAQPHNCRWVGSRHTIFTDDGLRRARNLILHITEKTISTHNGNDLGFPQKIIGGASLIEISGKRGEEGGNSREFDTGGIEEVEDSIVGDTSGSYDTL